MITVGQRIKERRKELLMTQTDLAKRIGVSSKAAVSRVENGREDLTTDRVRKYAKALNCTPAYLMGWDTNNYDTLVEAYRVAPIKEKKAICAILDIPFKE